MAILQGSWISRGNSGHLFIWGETWRTKAFIGSSSSNGALSHPFAMTQAELTSLLRFHRLSLDQFVEASGSSRQGRHKPMQPSKPNKWQAKVMTLPTQTTSKEGAYQKPVRRYRWIASRMATLASRRVLHWTIGGCKTATSATSWLF